MVADDAGGLALPPRDQFKVYGGYWVGIGVLFLAMFAAGLLRSRGHYVAVYRAEGVWLGEGGSQGREDPSQRNHRPPQNQPESSADIFSTQH